MSPWEDITPLDKVIPGSRRCIETPSPIICALRPMVCQIIGSDSDHVSAFFAALDEFETDNKTADGFLDAVFILSKRGFGEAAKSSIAALKDKYFPYVLPNNRLAELEQGLAQARKSSQADPQAEALIDTLLDERDKVREKFLLTRLGIEPYAELIRTKEGYIFSEEAFHKMLLDGYRDNLLIRKIIQKKWNFFRKLEIW